MQAIHDVLRKSLAASLSGLSQLDRLGAAWPVVAGHAIAERSAVTDFADGVVTVTAESPAWQSQLLILRAQLRSDLARVSHVPVTDILFVSASEDGQEQPRGGVTVQQEARGKLI